MGEIGALSPYDAGRANQVSGATHTYVVCEAERVIAYYALASGAATVDNSTGRFRRKHAGSHPRRRVGQNGRRWRLARPRDWGARIVVHALSQEAKNFYLALGFDPSPCDPMMLIMTLSGIRAALS